MTLGGATFIYNGEQQDYCWRETIDCLLELCDQVVVCDAGSTDGTQQLILERYSGKVDIISMLPEQWNMQQGREKLSHFSNIAIRHLNTDWFFYLQADEIIHENSFDFIREAITFDNIDGYLVRRHNLWRDPLHRLNVPQERKPCSTEVIRLARRGHYCVGDAESLAVNNVHTYGDINNMEIFHMGFVRDKKKHLEKIRHMQDEVFLIEHDKRIDGMETFNSYAWFDDNDIVPIGKPLPRFIQQWSRDRYPELF